MQVEHNNHTGIFILDYIITIALGIAYTALTTEIQSLLHVFLVGASASMGKFAFDYMVTQYKYYKSNIKKKNLEP